MGNHADGVYGTSGAAFEGLVTMAGSNKTQSATAFASESLTALHLLAARKNMGKYGMNPARRNYISLILQNTTAYYKMQNSKMLTLVGSDVATKLRGEIGSVFGSKVIVCDEFATPATR